MRAIRNNRLRVEVQISRPRDCVGVSKRKEDQSIMKTVAAVLILVSLLGGAIAAVAAPIRSVTVTGALTAGGAAGSYINVTCAPRGNVLTGTGTLYGVNPGTGYRYSYPIVITSSRTTTNTLVLTGKFAAGYPLTIMAATPSGNLTFSYVLPNRTTVVSTGTGTVVTR